MVYSEEAQEYTEELGIIHDHAGVSSLEHSGGEDEQGHLSANETRSPEPIYYTNDRDEEVTDPGPGPYMVRLNEITLLQYTLGYC
jgi:hypothetical protein